MGYRRNFSIYSKKSYPIIDQYIERIRIRFQDIVQNLNFQNKGYLCILCNKLLFKITKDL